MASFRVSDTFTATRDGWHRVAEHVLAAAQYSDTGEISLRPSPGGFETTHLLRGERRLRVQGARLVVRDPVGDRAVPLTTIADVADAIGCTPGIPASVYPPATPLEPTAELRIDEESARLLADWFADMDTALRRLASELRVPAEQPILWPEHFDVGITVGAVNFGASPGDEHVAEPYVYVGPHAGPPRRDSFWNATFGAVRTINEIPTVDAAVEFFETGWRAL